MEVGDDAAQAAMMPMMCGLALARMAIRRESVEGINIFPYHFTSEFRIVNVNSFGNENGKMDEVILCICRHNMLKKKDDDEEIEL